MRQAVCLILVCGAVGLLSGCAQRQDPAIAAAPTHDELPTYMETERVLPASIGVEGQNGPKYPPIVRKYKEPELTPTERKALGIAEPQIDFLALYQPLRRGTPAASWMGSINVGTAGIGGASVTVGSYWPIWAINRFSAGGAATAIAPMPTSTFRVGPASPTAVGRAGQGGVTTAEGPARRVAEHERQPPR